uniref:Sugar phosphate transporter domain-containing protein n=2 Tax=Solanum tuberosum TaxID=4113 RepID=M0ZM64_SOLTU
MNGRETSWWGTDHTWVLSPKYFNFPLPITLTMIHMGFSGLVAFLLIRVFKVVSPVKMTFEIYATCVIPISAFFASSLWFGNTAYLFISVAFIQMLKALMPVATFVMAVICGTDKLRYDLFLNMLLVSVGVVVSSYGEIHFNIVGTVYQVTGIFAEALRLVLTQVLLQKKGLTLNPITSLYYIAPCSASVLFLGVAYDHMFQRAALSFSLSHVIGRTGAVTIRVAGVLKDWILIALSTLIFPESTITTLNITGYAIALCGVVMYNYLKIKDVRAVQLPVDSVSDRIAKELKMEKKSSDLYVPDDIVKNSGGKGSRNGSPDSIVDEEAPFIPSRVKDASDKKILVDMLFWAVDNPAPANYLLISGSADFSYAIHQLRMRRYNILLAQPFNNASPALAAAATNVWQWTTLAAGKSQRELAFRNTNTLRQYYIPIPISKPTSANQPAYSNANANANTSKAQSLYNPGRYFDTPKTIYVPKNSNQLTTTSMSGTPAIVEEASSSNYPRAPDVAPVLFAPHLFFTKSDSSEKHNSRIEETSSSWCPRSPMVASHLLFAKSDSSNVKLGLELNLNSKS